MMDFLKGLFILEGEHGQEGQKERTSSKHFTESRAWHGAQSRDFEIMIWAEAKNPLFNQSPRCPNSGFLKEQNHFFEHKYMILCKVMPLSQDDCEDSVKGGAGTTLETLQLVAVAWT